MRRSFFGATRGVISAAAGIPGAAVTTSAAAASTTSSFRTIPPARGPYYALTLVSGNSGGAVPETMRAAVYRGPRDVVVEERPVPELGPRDVLLEVSHCGVCGSDLHMFVDGWGAPNSIGGRQDSGRGGGGGGERPARVPGGGGPGRRAAAGGRGGARAAAP